MPLSMHHPGATGCVPEAFSPCHGQGGHEALGQALGLPLQGESKGKVSAKKPSRLYWALSLQIEKPQQAPDQQLLPNQDLSSTVEGAGGQEVRTRGPALRPLPSPPLQPRSPGSFCPQVPGAGALSRACGLVQQLHVAYSTLASGLQGLPAELQRPVGQARHSLCKLYGVISSAASVEELPAECLARSRESIGQAWQGLEQLLESVQHSPPLGWLVGPFTLHPGGQQL